MIHSKLHFQHRDRFFQTAFTWIRLFGHCIPLSLTRLWLSYGTVVCRWWFISAGTVKQTSFQSGGSYAAHPGMVNQIPVRGMRKSSDQDTSPRPPRQIPPCRFLKCTEKRLSSQCRRWLKSNECCLFWQPYRDAVTRRRNYDREVVHSTQVRKLLHKNFRQVAPTPVSLSLYSIIWYRCKNR